MLWCFLSCRSIRFLLHCFHSCPDGPVDFQKLADLAQPTEKQQGVLHVQAFSLFILIACFLPVKYVNYITSGNSTDAKHLVSVFRWGCLQPIQQERFSGRVEMQWQILFCSCTHFAVLAISTMAPWLIIMTRCQLLASFKEHPLQSFSRLIDIDSWDSRTQSLCQTWLKFTWTFKTCSGWEGVWEAGELAKWLLVPQEGSVKWCMQTWNGASNCSSLLKQLKIIWQIWSTSNTMVLWGRRQLYVCKSCLFIAISYLTENAAFPGISFWSSIFPQEAMSRDLTQHPPGQCCLGISASTNDSQHHTQLSTLCLLMARGRAFGQPWMFAVLLKIPL